MRSHKKYAHDTTCETSTPRSAAHKGKHTESFDPQPRYRTPREFDSYSLTSDATAAPPEPVRPANRNSRDRVRWPTAPAAICPTGCICSSSPASSRPAICGYENRTA